MAGIMDSRTVQVQEPGSGDTLSAPRIIARSMSIAPSENQSSARSLLSSLPPESRNIPRRSRALVIDRLRAAVEALLCAQAGVPNKPS